MPMTRPARRRALTMLLGSLPIALAFLGLGAIPAAAVTYATPTPMMATPTPTGPAAPSSVTVGVGTTSLGSVLVAPDGHTLYTLSSDPNDGSVCTGGCLGFWPPLVVASGGTVTAATGAMGTFATFVRSDTGESQVTRDKRPLYEFKNDTAAGQTNGEGIKAFGGVWHAALASITSVPASTATPASTLPPTTSSGSGSGPTGDVLPLLLLLLVAGSGALAVSARMATTRNRD